MHIIPHPFQATSTIHPIRGYKQTQLKTQSYENGFRTGSSGMSILEFFI